MTYLIIYLTGCIITYFLIAIHNDKLYKLNNSEKSTEDMKIGYFPVLWSYFSVLLFGIYYIYTLIWNMNISKPTLSWIKKRK